VSKMSTVGTGFGAFQPSMMINRIPRNPSDVCTIVSCYPKEIRDNKVTTFPKLAPIPASPLNDYTLVIIEAVAWLREQQDGPMLEMYVTSKQAAESYIRDFVNGLVGYNPDQSAPGLFRCYGRWTRANIKTYIEPETNETFDQLLDKARTRQKNWFTELVRQTDSMWARSGGNPLVVGDDARMAAEVLGLKEQKPWMKDMVMMSMSNCPACGTTVNPNYPVCPNCKAIVNEEKAALIGLKFAQ
jgi:hypothetical protein